MLTQSLGQALLSKFFSRSVEGLGDAVGVEGDGIAAEELALPDCAIPLLKQSQNGGGGVQAFESVIAAKQEAGEMSAVGVAQALRLVVIFSEEERGIGAVGRVVVEQLIDGA